MALPTTITGLNVSVLAGGPFNSSAGNVYFFGRDDTTFTTLRAYKATDPATSFSVIASSTGLAADIQYISAFQNGDVVHIAIIDGATTSCNLKYRTFDMSTDSFVVSETVQSAFNPTGVNGNFYYCSIVYRSSDSQPIILYNGAKSGTDARIVYARRTGVNTWTTNVAVDAGGAFDYCVTAVALGSSDRVHFFWGQYGSGGAFHRTLTSANVLQTESGVHSSFNPVATNIRATSYNQSGTTKVIVLGNDGGGAFLGFYFDSADNPTVNTNSSVTANYDVHVSSWDGPNYPARAVVIYPKSNGDIYTRESTDDGATWGAESASLYAGASTSFLSYNAQVFLRGSSFIYPVLFNDSGTIKYDEYTVGSNAFILAPSLFANSQTYYPPTVTAPYSPPYSTNAPKGWFDSENTSLAFFDTILSLKAWFDKEFIDSTSSGALSPSTFSNTNVFHPATITRGAVNLAPTKHDNAAAFFAITVLGIYSLTAQIVTDGDTVYPSTVTVGAVSLLPNTFSDGDVFHVPTVGRGAVNLAQTSTFVDDDTTHNATVTLSGVNLSPNLVNDGDTFHSATVDRGAVNLAPDVVVNVSSVHSATVGRGAVNLAPTLVVVDGDTIYNATVTIGTVNLSPSLVVDGDTVHNATVTVGAMNLSPSLVIDGDIVPTHTVSAGAVNVAPSLVVDGDVVPAHQVDIGVTNLSPAHFSDGDIVYSATVNRGAVNLSPPLYVDSDTIAPHIVSPGVVGLSPSTVVDGDTIYTHSLSSVKALLAPHHVDSEGFFAHTLGVGAVNLSPMTVENAQIVYQGTVLPGPWSLIQSILIVDDDSIYAPSISQHIRRPPIVNVSSGPGPMVTSVNVSGASGLVVSVTANDGGEVTIGKGSTTVVNVPSSSSGIIVTPNS